MYSFRAAWSRTGLGLLSERIPEASGGRCYSLAFELSLYVARKGERWGYFRKAP